MWRLSEPVLTDEEPSDRVTGSTSRLSTGTPTTKYIGGEGKQKSDSKHHLRSCVVLKYIKATGRVLHSAD